MKSRLRNKRVLLGISGGIAAYKCVELVRRLTDEGASVTVVMTEAACQFVSPLALQIASHNKVFSSLFGDPMAHITLPSDTDLLIIAPATADIVAKFANGIGDDLLTTCMLAYPGKVLLAPSMNWRMYENRHFRRNLETLLSSSDVVQVGPGSGDLACGEEGTGRMAEVGEIIDAAGAVLTPKDLVNEEIVVTAGPTREYLDPVRFISNRSSGKMGYAIARAARDRGARVTLITGPSVLAEPSGLKFVKVETSAEMFAAVQREAGHSATALIMAAAVSDFAPAGFSEKKIEKAGEFSLALRSTGDIISSLQKKEGKPFIIGFAAETGENTGRAAEKMRRKNMDMIVFNNVLEPGCGFDVDTNRVTLIDSGGERRLDLMDKDSVADAVLDRFLELKA